MAPETPRLLDAVLLLFTGVGRERMRRLQEAETEAILAARRIHMLRQLACMAEYQLGIADIARKQAIAAQPAIEAWAARVLDSFTAAVARELDDYGHGRIGGAPR